MDRLCSVIVNQTKPTDAVKDALHDAILSHSVFPSIKSYTKSLSSNNGSAEAINYPFDDRVSGDLSLRSASRGEDAYGFNNTEPIRLYLHRLIPQSP